MHGVSAFPFGCVSYFKVIYCEDALIILFVFVEVGVGE